MDGTLGTFSKLLSTVLALPNRWRIARCRSLLAPILERERTVRLWTDAKLRQASLSLRFRAQSGEPAERLLAEAYALMRVAMVRARGKSHYPVQLLGGLILQQRAIAEMQTGEGKTLTASLPTYLAALLGKGVHVATANDYLAARDAEFVRPAFELLGLNVGAVTSAASRDQRRHAYQCDVTYGTAKEFGFDFLRDKLLGGHASAGRRGSLGRMLGDGRESRQTPLQRGLHFALVDEADSILIDEARTPLLISFGATGSPQLEQEVYRWAAAAQREFGDPQHYSYDPQMRTATLSAEGRQLVRECPKPKGLSDVPLFDLYERVEQAILAARDFHRDRQYIVRDGRIVIVDEFTGRIAEGRQWRAGLHQALEAKEGLPITAPATDAARVMIQELFQQYERLAGMTGTAWTSRRELWTVYRMRVVPLPPHRPSRRLQLPDHMWGNSAGRWQAIVDEVVLLRQSGRPVIIGTRSIDKSEALSERLYGKGVPHQVLNARYLADEAAIIAEAGQLGRVTVATNMAGRGTDIELGPGVADLGGLHVIASELHESARIDRQLMGRCGRQGDPGSFRQFMSLDDEIILAGLGPVQAERWRDRGAAMPGPCHSLAWVARRAQAKVEKEHFRQRRELLHQERERVKLHQQMGRSPYVG